MAHQVHRPHVNAEFERSGRYQNFHLAFFQLPLRLQAQLARQTSVMRRHVFLTQSLSQLMGNAFGQPPRVHENQRRAVRVHQLHDALVNLVPHLVGGDRAQFGGWNLDSEIERALVSNIHDHRIGTPIPRQEMRNLFDRLLGRGKPDAHRRSVSQRLQPLQRKRQMHAPFVVGHGVNFIHNHGLHIAQDGAALLRRQQNVERLRRRNQNVRRALQHEPPVFHQSVARAHGRPDLRHQQPAISRHLQNFSQRDFKILLNVVAEGFERGNIENVGAVAQFPGEGFADEAINACQKSGQRLARSRRSRDKSSVAGKNVRPALLLRFRRRREARREPFLNQRMSPGKRRRDGGGHGKDCSENWWFRKIFAF